MKANAGIVPSGSRELLVRARGGEREAFTELVERYHPELVRIGYAVIGDLDGARDAAQTAWIKAWQRLPSVREPDNVRAWLLAIAANEARQHVRARSRRRVREIVPVDPDRVSGSSLARSADRLDLTAALGRLGPADRELLALRYLGGLTAEEIGIATGLSASGIRSRLSRLIARLREDLRHD